MMVEYTDARAYKIPIRLILARKNLFYMLRSYLKDSKLHLSNPIDPVIYYLGRASARLQQK